MAVINGARIDAILKGALLAGMIGGGLSACASVTPAPQSFSAVVGSASSTQSYQTAQAPKRPGAPRYKLGGPYQAGGVWYVPADQPNYDEVGLGSWYGDAFNGKATADGEMFDMDSISAAHATLPLPCIAEVTNLDNGKIIQVRINDRGPFHPGRIIDLSRGAAKALGYYEKGTARVRVRFVALAPLGGSNALNAPVMTSAAQMHGLTPPESALSYPMPPAAEPIAEPAPGALPSGYLVQVGAFSERANADRAAAKVAHAGRTRIEPLDRNGIRLYRVTVTGDWRDAETAGTARAQVAGLGFADAKVIAGS
jgi:rare lipoprotein A